MSNSSKGTISKALNDLSYSAPPILIGTPYPNSASKDLVPACAPFKVRRKAILLFAGITDPMVSGPEDFKMG